MKRKLMIGGGVISQCLLCSRIGLEVGTSYMTFDEADFIRFASWFDALEEEPSDSENERVYIQFRKDADVMLSLGRREHGALAELLREGVRWLSTGSVGAPREVCPPAEEAEVWLH